jgi:hypothetical protein
MQPNPEWIQMECRITGKPVCLVDENLLPVFYLAPFGECVECKSWIHEDALDYWPGMLPASYPIEYTGFTCIECANDSNPAN